MQCPTYLDCVRNGLHTVSQDSTAFLVHMPNGAFVCEDMAAKFDGPLPRMALMLRDPFSLVISSYIYHAQRPTPEDWVITEFTAPCVPNAEQTCVSLSLSLNVMHAHALLLTLTPHLPTPFDAHGGEAVTIIFSTLRRFMNAQQVAAVMSTGPHHEGVLQVQAAHVSSFCVYAA